MFTNMKIGMKLGLGFGFMALLLCVMAAIAGFGMNRLGDSLVDITDNKVPKVLSAYNIIDQINRVARAQRNILLLNDPAEMKKEIQNIDTAEQIVSSEIDKLRKVIYSEQGKQLLQKVADSMAAYLPGRKEVAKFGMEGKKAEAIEVLYAKVRPSQLAYFQAVEDIIQYQTRLMEDSEKAAVELDKMMYVLLLTISGISLLLAAGAGFGITRSISKPVSRVAAGLSDSSQQVVAASTQVASAAQALAEGASEQAAGIEETSSSMEEMSSMTRQNADNAGQANKLMAETTRVVDEANRAMSDLNDSMKEIYAASEETAKIIKTIDEIAFQTNLLALNAAVEAARAGESGAGFAVVADEVRNLALRAAEAARNTANLIEGTVGKVKNGSDVVSKTNEAFAKVAAGARRVEELVGEISAASVEQAQGITQISSAVAEMDRVVQQNASAAEEAASAAEQMNSQASHMKSFVQELMAVVGGNSARRAV